MLTAVCGCEPLLRHDGPHDSVALLDGEECRYPGALERIQVLEKRLEALLKEKRKMSRLLDDVAEALEEEHKHNVGHYSQNCPDDCDTKKLLLRYARL